ncbi:MAG: flagellin [Gammaproteobacteria bacterium]|nr:flagellin [Gammaproteobacteria bacterium]
MALSFISNFAANVAHRNLINTDMRATSSLAKLSSGQRVVQAKDDAAALAIGSGLASEVAALTQAGVNAGQASSMLQIADGAMARATEILQRMKSLAVQSSSGQLSNTERAILDLEYQALKNEIARIGNDTEFNSVKLLNGSQTYTRETGNTASFVATNGFDGIRSNNISFAGTNSSVALDLSMATGALGVSFGGSDGNGGTYSAVISTTAFAAGLLVTNTSITLNSNDANNKGTITIDLNTALSATQSLSAGANNGTVSGSAATSFTFKVGTGSVAAEDDLTFSIGSLVAIADALATTIQTAANANTASAEVSTSINTLNTNRAQVGANMSRLDFAAANIATARENAEAARSQLLDLDVAAEMIKFTSAQVLLQAGVSMLAQANQLPQNLLRLFA